MKPEAQRIAIAEACGWKFREHEQRSYWYLHDNVNPQWKTIDELPDYPSDLNAMHEAEKVLTQDQQDEYRDNLKQVCFDQWEHGKIPQIHSIFATAAQRAEAFLRTLNLWKDDDKRATIALESS